MTLSEKELKEIEAHANKFYDAIYTAMKASFDAGFEQSVVGQMVMEIGETTMMMTGDIDLRRTLEEDRVEKESKS